MFDQYLELFNYDLPKERIAQTPVEPRDHSKLLHLRRNDKHISHQRFDKLIELIDKNDVLVFNQTKVMPVRLLGKKSSGGHVELLLLHSKRDGIWQCIGKPRLKLKQELHFGSNLTAKIISRDEHGYFNVQFNQQQQKFLQTLNILGQTPIPPYITKSLSEEQLRIKYQTVYAKYQGSAAAPTAGLHFTKALLDNLSKRGVQQCFVTLHVGLGTFQNLRPQQLKSGKLHSENYSISQNTAKVLNLAKQNGKKIIAVGTTTTRVLESMTRDDVLNSGKGKTNLFIRPGYKFKFVDKMITNFHLPKSSLLMLISAFTSKPQTNQEFEKFSDSVLGAAYKEAIERKYCFFSFGDAMLID